VVLELPTSLPGTPGVNVAAIRPKRSAPLRDPRVTPEGINDELRPWMTMSVPRGVESLTVDNTPIGTPTVTVKPLSATALRSSCAEYFGCSRRS